MKKNERVKILIEHILGSIMLIEKYTVHSNKSSFLKNEKLQDATIRRIAIIGEAVKHLPTKLRQNYPEIPWKDIAGMRDILVHEYFDVDISATWQTIVSDLPKLKRKLEKIYTTLDS